MSDVPPLCDACEAKFAGCAVIGGAAAPGTCAACGARLEAPARVFLGVAVYRDVKAGTMIARESLVWARGGEAFDLVGSQAAVGYGTARNLELLADGAIETKADLLVYHDADVAFTAADVDQLVRGWQRYGPEAIVGAFYAEREGGKLVGHLCGPLGEDGRVRTDPAMVERLRADGFEYVEALSLGFGLVALPVALLVALRRERGYAFGEAHFGLKGTTPDVEFCGAAKQRGFTVVAALGARPSHLTERWT